MKAFEALRFNKLPNHLASIPARAALRNVGVR
jgi:hypothetical protein